MNEGMAGLYFPYLSPVEELEMRELVPFIQPAALSAAAIVLTHLRGQFALKSCVNKSTMRM